MTRNNLLLIGTTSMTTVNMVRNNRRVVVWRDHNSKLLIQTLVLCGGKSLKAFWPQVRRHLEFSIRKKMEFPKHFEWLPLKAREMALLKFMSIEHPIGVVIVISRCIASLLSFGENLITDRTSSIASLCSSNIWCEREW